MDSDNCVAEGPGFNVCIVKDGKLASPSRNALPGITRKTVFEIADAMGIEATLRDVTSHELYDADELMAVTTAGGVTPITSLDGEPIGDGTPGTLTTAIRDRFWALDGRAVPADRGDRVLTIYPIVAQKLSAEMGMPAPISDSDGTDPSHYQSFAITPVDLVFFFGRGELMAGAAGAHTVYVPRNAIPPLSV